MSNTPRSCEARHVSDQMQCYRCNLIWDTNDTDPPECGIKRAADATLGAIRADLAPKPGDAALLMLREVPLLWLPTCGINPHLLKINWPSQPEARYLTVRRVRDQRYGQSRAYCFYGDNGAELFEVIVTDSDGRRTGKIRRGGLVADL